MKKLFIFAVAFIMSSNTSNAESVIVIGEDGVVKQQIYTFNDSNINTQQYPQISVVRETPKVANSYYYDNISTGEAIAAGITTAVVGALLFDGFKIHHHNKHKPIRVHKNKFKSKHKPHKKR